MGSFSHSMSTALFFSLFCLTSVYFGVSSIEGTFGFTSFPCFISWFPVYAKAYTAGLLSGPFNHSCFVFFWTHRGHNQTKPDKTRADVITSISAKLHDHPSHNTTTASVHQTVVWVCKINAVNGALIAFDIFRLCIGRNNRHPHKHQHTQCSEVSNLSLHTVASKTERWGTRRGVACFLCDQDVESLHHDNLHFLFRVRAASVQTNGQSRTDHEAEIAKRQRLLGLSLSFAEYVVSHSLCNTGIPENFMNYL